MVEIYIQTCWSDGWICALDIPLEDILRHSLRPLKWLRFVAFAVLGAEGHIVDKNGIVDYDTDSSGHLDNSYLYFVLDRRYHLADHHGLAYVLGRSSGSPSTARRPAFSHNVRRRDNNHCVITNSRRCHAAHIIPHSKGDEYIRFVISERGSLYEDQLGSNINISWMGNGVCLRSDICDLFETGACAFLKTPNFALNPDDIPMVGSGETPVSRTTMQYLQPEPADSLDTAQARDVRVDWSDPDTQPPPSILLDYMYGVSAIQLWASDSIKELLEVHHRTYPSKISSKPMPSNPGGNDGVELGNPAGTEQQMPSTSHHTIYHESNESQLSRAVDKAFAFAMFVRGYPPGTTFAMFHQKLEEEVEKRSRQVAQEKVQRWLETTRADSSHDTKC